MPALTEELVLGAAQADALSAAFAGAVGVLGGVGVGAHAQTTHAIGYTAGPVDRVDEVLGLPGSPWAACWAASRPLGDISHDRGVDDRDLADEDLSGGAVDGDDVAPLSTVSPTVIVLADGST